MKALTSQGQGHSDEMMTLSRPRMFCRYGQIAFRSAFSQWLLSLSPTPRHRVRHRSLFTSLFGFTWRKCASSNRSLPENVAVTFLCARDRPEHGSNPIDLLFDKTVFVGRLIDLVGEIARCSLGLILARIASNHQARWWRRFSSRLARQRMPCVAPAVEGVAELKRCHYINCLAKDMTKHLRPVPFLWSHADLALRSNLERLCTDPKLLGDITRSIRSGSRDEHRLTPGVGSCTQIDALFEIGRSINGETPERVRVVSQELSAPLVADLENWMHEQRIKLSRRYDVARAMDYMLKGSNAFTCYLCLSNNAAERAVRGIAMERKSWLFCGSDRAIVIICSPIITAKMNHMDMQRKCVIADGDRSLYLWLNACSGRS